MGRLLLAVAVVLAGCQVYDFEPVSPYALAQTRMSRRYVTRALDPEVVVLIDRSRSMELPADPADARCPTGCGVASACPAECPTRISEVRRAMDVVFRDAHAPRVRWGLAAFPATPEANNCAATSAFVRPLPPETFDDESVEVRRQGALIANDLHALVPGGGTPTAASLEFVRAALASSTSRRQRFVMLLTDGLPNCDATNPNAVCVDRSPEQVGRCSCTSGACDSASTCARGCLDRSAVNAVARLAADGVSTYVVGFGDDVNSTAAREVLSDMARAGRTARFCVTQADCEGYGLCANHTCSLSHFRASDAEQLARVFDVIFGDVRRNPCQIVSEAPIENPELVSVVDEQGVPFPRSDWTIDLATSTIQLQGELCTRVNNATAAKPFYVEVRVLESL